MNRILLIEDEPGVAMTIADLLMSERYEVSTALDGESGVEMASGGAFSAIILDVMLPRKSGFEVCRELRQKGIDTAILMLTARTQVVDRVVGLKFGADDYLVKPFDPAELLARLEALLRRVQKHNRISVTTFEFADVEIDFNRAEVRKGGKPVTLASKELQLLRYLIDNRDRVVPRDEIMRNVWDIRATFHRERSIPTWHGCARRLRTIRRRRVISRRFADGVIASMPSLPDTREAGDPELAANSQAYVAHLPGRRRDESRRGTHECVRHVKSICRWCFFGVIDDHNFDRRFAVLAPETQFRFHRLTQGFPSGVFAGY